jgi:hypothetical protein
MFSTFNSWGVEIYHTLFSMLINSLLFLTIIHRTLTSTKKSLSHKSRYNCFPIYAYIILISHMIYLGDDIYTFNNTNLNSSQHAFPNYSGSPNWWWAQTGFRLVQSNSYMGFLIIKKTSYREIGSCIYMFSWISLLCRRHFNCFPLCTFDRIEAELLSQQPMGVAVPCIIIYPKTLILNQIGNNPKWFYTILNTSDIKKKT